MDPAAIPPVEGGGTHRLHVILGEPVVTLAETARPSAVSQA
jgi:hypothetical protein